jgi:hypothetical protein
VVWETRLQEEEVLYILLRAPFRDVLERKREHLNMRLSRLCFERIYARMFWVLERDESSL